MPDAPAPALTALQCPGCRLPVARCTATRLHLGTVLVAGKQRLTCTACGYTWTWRPDYSSLTPAPQRRNV